MGNWAEVVRYATEDKGEKAKIYSLGIFAVMYFYTKTFPSSSVRDVYDALLVLSSGPILYIAICFTLAIFKLDKRKTCLVSGMYWLLPVIVAVALAVTAPSWLQTSGESKHGTAVENSEIR